MVAHFGDLDTRCAVVHECNGRRGESALLTGGMNLVDEDLCHALVTRIIQIDHAGTDTHFEVRPGGAHDFHTLRHVFKNGRSGTKEHGGHMESANAIFEFLQDEGLENLRWNVIEFVGRNLGRVEKRNRMNGLAYLLTQSFCKTA